MPRVPRRKTRRPAKPRTIGEHLLHVHRRCVHHLKRTFVPHEGNDFRPHALRPKALSIYAAVVIVAKLAVTVLLFSVYPNPGYYSATTAERFFELTNSARAEADVATLALNPKLSRAASRKAEDMLRQGYFAHTTPQGKKFWQWIKEEKYQFSFAGENLAIDFADADVAQEALMNSAGHRTNILNAKFKEVGFAVKTGTFQGRTTTVLVELFGKPLPVVSRPAAKPAKLPAVEEKKKPPAPAKPTKVAAATEAAPAPTFLAQRQGPATLDLALNPGEQRTLTFAYTNRGQEPWQPDGDRVIFLEAIDPVGRASALTSAGWLSPSRAAAASEATVKTGETGHWNVAVAAPAKPGIYVERFALRSADGAVLSDTELTLNLTVEVAVVTETAVPPTTATGVAPEAPGATEESAPTDEASIVEAVTETAPAAAQPAAPARAQLTRNAVATSNNLLLFFIVFLTIALFINLIVRYEIQHRHIIVGTVLLIILTAGMLIFGIHFLEIVQRTSPQVA